jgi:lipopolysaccharide transport system ATP-binding protein
MKAPPVSISCQDLTLRFPVYGVDAKSLKKSLAKITVGGRLGRSHGATEVTAISGLNMELRAGDRLGLVGHNGSGKTTLLRALSGAYEPDEGSIEVQGRIAPLLDLNLGIDPSASGYENIRLRGRIAGLSAKEVETRMDEIAAFTGLGPFLAMPVKTYSAGMQARLAFAAATSVEADVLLMDEWIAVGDAEFQQLAHRRLLKLVERAGHIGAGQPRSRPASPLLQQGHADGGRRRLAGHRHPQARRADGGLTGRALPLEANPW